MFQVLLCCTTLGSRPIGEAGGEARSLWRAHSPNERANAPSLSLQTSGLHMPLGPLRLALS